MLDSLVVPEVLVSVEVLVVPEELVSKVLDLLQAKRNLCVQKALPLPVPKVLDAQTKKGPSKKLDTQRLQMIDNDSDDDTDRSQGSGRPENRRGPGREMMIIRIWRAKITAMI